MQLEYSRVLSYNPYSAVQYSTVQYTQCSIHCCRIQYCGLKRTKFRHTKIPINCQVHLLHCLPDFGGRRHGQASTHVSTTHIMIELAPSVIGGACGAPTTRYDNSRVMWMKASMNQDGICFMFKTLTHLVVERTAVDSCSIAKHQSFGG